MKYALIGYGRMGRAVEEAAGSRGHELSAVVDPAADRPGARRRLDPARLEGAEVAFEFTGASAAEDNVVTLLEAGIPVVCGTTGWSASGSRLARAAEAAGAVVAPNFSVGMNLFYRVVQEAARLAAASGMYDPYVLEIHHRRKLDAPSGTAARLASILTEVAPEYGPVQFGFPAQGPVPPRVVHVASVRSGHEPGTHTVGFDGEHDRLELVHRARGRGGFALGAVLAGEWVRGRRGVHGFDRVLEDLLDRGEPA